MFDEIDYANFPIRMYKQGITAGLANNVHASILKSHTRHAARGRRV